jgi:hypothetical protein
MDGRHGYGYEYEYEHEYERPESNRIELEISVFKFSAYVQCDCVLKSWNIARSFVKSPQIGAAGRVG